MKRYTHKKNKHTVLRHPNSAILLSNYSSSHVNQIRPFAIIVMSIFGMNHGFVNGHTKHTAHIIFLY